MNENKKAHLALDEFNKLCNHYNNDGFSGISHMKELLRIYIKNVIKAGNYFLFLIEKENCEAVRMYLLFYCKLYTRLNSLIENNRPETDAERLLYIHSLENKLGVLLC